MEVTVTVLVIGFLRFGMVAASVVADNNGDSMAVEGNARGTVVVGKTTMSVLCVDMVMVAKMMVAVAVARPGFSSAQEGSSKDGLHCFSIKSDNGIGPPPFKALDPFRIIFTSSCHRYFHHNFGYLTALDQSRLRSGR